MMLNAQLTLTPNPTANGICPGASRTFTVNGIPSGCTGYTLALQTGNTTFSTSGDTFIIQSANLPQNIVVSYTKGANEECPANQTFTIPVLSVAGQIPVISGFPGQLVRGRSTTFTLNASHFYSFSGTQDPQEVASYTWAFSSGGTGWSVSYSNGSNTNGTTIVRKSAAFTTDNCSAATISVFSTDHCGNTSLTATISIGRFTEQPSLAGAPSSVVCCRTESFNLNASQATSGLSGYSYVWDFGSWSGTANGSSATTTANGTSGTTISVIASACGEESVPSSSQVSIVPIDPATAINGSNILCNNQQGSYQITPTLESCASTTWSISPASAVSPSQGIGSNALFTTNPNYNGTISVNYEITTPCGVSTRTSTVHVGKPVMHSVTTPQCFNRYRYYNLTVNASGASQYYWTVPGCNSPIPPDPLTYPYDCWHVVEQNPASQPQMRIYSGEQEGYISVWVSNQCGEVSRAIPIIWCNPREDGPGPIIPRTGNPTGSLAIFAELEEGDEIDIDVMFLNIKDREADIFKVKVYPNPVSDAFILEIEKRDNEPQLNVGIKEVKIYDIHGRNIGSYIQQSEQYIIPMQDKVSGRYYVQVEFTNGKIQVIPIIKIE